MTVALLGAPVPVDDLAFWIRGAAREGGAASVERDALGRVLVLRQQAWEIVYSYPDDAPGSDAFARRAEAPGRRTRRGSRRRGSVGER